MPENSHSLGAAREAQRLRRLLANQLEGKRLQLRQRAATVEFARRVQPVPLHPNAVLADQVALQRAFTYVPHTPLVHDFPPSCIFDQVANNVAVAPAFGNSSREPSALVFVELHGHAM